MNLQQFIVENCPASRVLDGKELAAIAARTGMTIITPGDKLAREVYEVGVQGQTALVYHEGKRYPSGYLKTNYICFEPSKGLEILWLSQAEPEKGVVCYRPHVRGAGNSSSGGGMASPEELILSHLGLAEVIVPLPERVVQMPVPGYVQGSAWDSGEAAVLGGHLVFISEARSLRDEYVKQLDELLK
jgi:hypothetical protein